MKINFQTSEIEMLVQIIELCNLNWVQSEKICLITQYLAFIMFKLPETYLNV